MEGKETKNTVAAAASSSPLFSFSNSNASFGFGFGFSASSGPPPPPPPPAVEVLLSEVYLARFPFFFSSSSSSFVGLSYYVFTGLLWCEIRSFLGWIAGIARRGRRIGACGDWWLPVDLQGASAEMLTLCLWKCLCGRGKTLQCYWFY